MKAGDLMFDEQINVYVIFIGYNEWNDIMVMYPCGFVYEGCELHLREV